MQKIRFTPEERLSVLAVIKCRIDEAKQYMKLCKDEEYIPRLEREVEILQSAYKKIFGRERR